MAGRVTALLDEYHLPYEIFDRVLPNPTIKMVQQGVAAWELTDALHLKAIALIGQALRDAVAWNADFTGEKYRDIALALGVEAARQRPLTEARLLAIQAVDQLCCDVGIPECLRDVGMLEAIADLYRQRF